MKLRSLITIVVAGCMSVTAACWSTATRTPPGAAPGADSAIALPARGDARESPADGSDDPDAGSTEAGAGAGPVVAPDTAIDQGRVVFGLLEEGRITSLDASDLLSAPGEVPLPAPIGWSPVVGAVESVTPIPDGRLFVAATDHRELVLVARDWKSLVTVSLDATLAPRAFVGYGSVVPVAASTIAVGLDVDGKAGVALLELATGEVRSATWPDMPASFTGMCEVSRGVLAVVGSDAVAFVDARTLERATVVAAPGVVAGAACSGGRVWAARLDSSSLLGFSRDAAPPVTVTWSHGPAGPAGRAGGYVTADADGSLLATDEATGSLVRCVPASGRCRVSAPLGARLTRPLVLGDHVVVPAELPGALHVVSRDLSVVRSVPIPAMPRGLALVAGPDLEEQS